MKKHLKTAQCKGLQSCKVLQQFFTDRITQQTVSLIRRSKRAINNLREMGKSRLLDFLLRASNKMVMGGCPPAKG
jgi:hypothetical protein